MRHALTSGHTQAHRYGLNCAGEYAVASPDAQKRLVLSGSSCSEHPGRQRGHLPAHAPCRYDYALRPHRQCGGGA